MATAATRLRRAFRPPRRLRFTRQGRWFVFMTLLVGFGAINTGNNLLYLMLGMMLGLILVSGVMSEAMLRRLRAQRLSSEPLYAGRPGRVEYRIENGKRRLPSFSIEVRELETRETRAHRRGRPGRLSRVSRRRRKRRRGAEAGEVVDSGVPHCFAHRVPAGGAVVRAGRIRLARRGLYRYRGLALITRFPFGFFEKSREIGGNLELLVYPRVVDPPALSAAPRRQEGYQSRRDAGRGDEYHGLRDYREGEDWRRIHWKVSARRPSPVVRENEQELTQTLVVALVHSATAGGPAAAERAIEVAAALVRERLAAGFSVGLVTQVGRIPLGVGGAQMARVLQALALLEVYQAPAPPPLRPLPRGVPVVLVAPRGWEGSVGLPRGSARVTVDASGRVGVAS